MSPRTLPIALAVCLLPLTSHAQVQQKGVWTDPADESIPAVYQFQGEYVGELDGGQKIGAQVIALNEEGAVQAVLYPGGLPGAGWDEKNKILLDGTLVDGAIELSPAEGDRKYMDGKPQRFGATRQFPPEGHQPWAGAIGEGVLRGKTEDGKSFILKKPARKSEMLGAKPRETAERWNEGCVADGILHTDAKDVRSKDKFKYYTVHLEFRTPFRPQARGQGRGNSGFYQTNGQEIQVLDSFGLEGLKNECGALYGRAAPRINMCLPPLAWQTYDVELLPIPDAENKNQQATLTVRHNGVVIHDKVPCKPGGGGFNLQGHGNLLQYRNIWLVEHAEPAASN